MYQCILCHYMNMFPCRHLAQLPVPRITWPLQQVVHLLNIISRQSSWRLRDTWIISPHQVCKLLGLLCVLSFVSYVFSFLRYLRIQASVSVVLSQACHMSGSGVYFTSCGCHMSGFSVHLSGFYLPYPSSSVSGIRLQGLFPFPRYITDKRHSSMCIFFFLIYVIYQASVFVATSRDG